MYVTNRKEFQILYEMFDTQRVYIKYCGFVEKIMNMKTVFLGWLDKHFISKYCYK